MELQHYVLLWGLSLLWLGIGRHFECHQRYCVAWKDYKGRNHYGPYVHTLYLAIFWAKYATTATNGELAHWVEGHKYWELRKD